MQGNKSHKSSKPTNSHRKTTKSTLHRSITTSKRHKVLAQHGSAVVNNENDLDVRTSPSTFSTQSSHPLASTQSSSIHTTSRHRSAITVARRSLLGAIPSHNGTNNDIKKNNTLQQITHLFSKRHFAIKKVPSKNPEHTLPSPTISVPIDVSKKQLFMPPQTAEDVKRRLKELSPFNPTEEQLELNHPNPASPTIPHPTSKGKFIGPRFYELHPDEVASTLMTPFLSGKFVANEFGQNPISQAVLNGNEHSLRQLLSYDVHEHCNAMAKRIKNDPRVNHPLKDFIYNDTSTPENPSFAVRYLLSQRDHDGICPLFYSLAKGQIELPRMLIAHGAYLGYEYIVPEAEIGANQKSAFENSLKQAQNNANKSSLLQKQQEHSKMISQEYQHAVDIGVKSPLSPDPALNQGVPADGTPEDPNLGQLVFDTEPGNPFLNPVKKTTQNHPNHPQNDTNTGADPIKVTPLYHTHTVLTIAAAIGDPMLVEMLLIAGANPNQILSSYQEQRLAGYADYTLDQTNIYRGQKRLFDIANQVEMEKSPVDRDLELLGRISNFYKTQDFYKNNLQIAESYLLKSSRFAKLPKSKFNFDPLVKRQEDMMRYADRTQQKAFFYHQTPLTTAVINGNTQLVELFVQHGADVQFSNYLHGQSLLEIAVYTNNTDILSQLLDGLVALRDREYQIKLIESANIQSHKLSDVAIKFNQHTIKMSEPEIVCATKQDLGQYALDQAYEAIHNHDPVAMDNMKRGIIGDLAIFNTDQEPIFVDYSRNQILANAFPKPHKFKKYSDMASVGGFLSDYSNFIPADFVDEKNRVMYLDPWKAFTPKFNNVIRIEPYRWGVIESLTSRIENELWNDHLKVLRSEGLDPLKSKSQDIFQITNDITPPHHRRTRLSKLEYLTLRGASIFEQLIDVVESNQYQAKLDQLNRNEIGDNKSSGVRTGRGKVIKPTLNPDKLHLDQSNSKIPQPPLIVTGRQKTQFDTILTQLLSGLTAVGSTLSQQDKGLVQKDSVVKPDLNDGKILINNNAFTVVNGYPPLFDHHLAQHQVDQMEQDIRNLQRTDPSQAAIMKQNLQHDEQFKLLTESKRLLNQRMDDWHNQYHQYIQGIYPIYSRHIENVAEVRKLAQYYSLNRRKNWVAGLDSSGDPVEGYQEMKNKLGVALTQNEFQYQQFLSTLPSTAIQETSGPNQVLIDQYVKKQNTIHLLGVQDFIRQYLRHKRTHGYSRAFQYTPDPNLPPSALNWDETFDPTDGFNPQNPDEEIGKDDIDPCNDPYWVLTPFDPGLNFEKNNQKKNKKNKKNNNNNKNLKNQQDNEDDDNDTEDLHDDDNEYVDLDMLGDLSIETSVYLSGLVKENPDIPEDILNKISRSRTQYKIYQDQINTLATDHKLTQILLQYDPSQGPEQMESLIKLEPFWATTAITPASGYYYYIKRRSHVPPDLPTFVNFNRLKDIAQHFGKVESLLMLGNYRGGIAVPPLQDEILVDIDQHVRFGDFNRSEAIEKIDGRFFQDLQLPTLPSPSSPTDPDGSNNPGAAGSQQQQQQQQQQTLTSTRIKSLNETADLLNHSAELQLNDMVTQHTIQDRNKRAAEIQAQEELDAMKPIAINNNLGLQEWQKNAKNDQVVKETDGVEKLHSLHRLINWIVESTKDGSLTKVCAELGLFGDDEEEKAPEQRKPFSFDDQIINFLSNSIAPILHKQAQAVRDYESELEELRKLALKDPLLDFNKESQKIPVVVKLDLPEEINELIPILEQMKETANNLSGFDVVGGLSVDDVAKMDFLSPEKKEFVTQELTKDQQLARDQQFILDNLDGINVPSLQIAHAREMVGKEIQANADRGRIPQESIDYYKKRGGLSKPYPLTYKKTTPQ